METVRDEIEILEKFSQAIEQIMNQITKIGDSYSHYIVHCCAICVIIS